MKYVVMNRLVTGETLFGNYTSLAAAKKDIKGLECKTIYKVGVKGREKVFSC